MLPAASTLRRSADFADIVRRGNRGGSRRLIVHLRSSATGTMHPSPDTKPPAPAHPARAGFVVSSAVGNSVVRHRLTRQLRPLLRERLGDQPAGTDIVVRVLPAAAGASSADLAADLDAAWRSAARGRTGRRTRSNPQDARR